MNSISELAKRCRVCFNESRDQDEDNKVVTLNPQQIEKLLYIGDSSEIVRFDDDRLGICKKCEIKLNWVYDFIVQFNATKAKFREYAHCYGNDLYEFNGQNSDSKDEEDNEAELADIVKVEHSSPAYEPTYPIEYPIENSTETEHIYDSYQIRTVEPTWNTNIGPNSVKHDSCSTPVPDTSVTLPSIKVKSDKKLISKVKHEKSATDNVCHICSKQFSTRANMLRHEREHMGRRFVCHYENCDSYFTQKSSLQVHIARHEGHKPYACDYCGKKFSQSKSLVFHVRIHTGESPYECEYCQKTFKQKSNLIRHFKSHAKARPMRPKRFQCVRCQKWMASKQSLLRHLMRHERIEQGLPVTDEQICSPVDDIKAGIHVMDEENFCQVEDIKVEPNYNQSTG